MVIDLEIHPLTDLGGLIQITMASLNDPQIETRDEEQVLYDYWLDRVGTDSPGESIEGFRRLFVEGRGHPEAPVYLALERLVKAKDGEIRYLYNFFKLYRCFFSLI